MRVQIQLYEGGRVHAENGQFKDLIVESAVTNIVDFEDSVAIVDAEDMVVGLRNYLGLLRGDLQGLGSQGNSKTLNSDKGYVDPSGVRQSLKATSLMSVRNVFVAHVHRHGPASGPGNPRADPRRVPYNHDRRHPR